LEVPSRKFYYSPGDGAVASFAVTNTDFQNVMGSPFVKDSGAVISGTSTVGSVIFVDGYGGYRRNADNLNKFLGVRFKKSASDTNFVFGWVNFSIVYNTDTDTIDRFTVHSWAYDDSGAPILAGAIPEPSGLTMVALGGLAVAGRRWRRIGQKVAA
jgi:hypothetical protein